MYNHVDKTSNTIQQNENVAFKKFAVAIRNGILFTQF